MKVEDFTPGVVVEIQAGPSYPHWNGKRGTVVEPIEAEVEVAGVLNPKFVLVRVSGEKYGIGGWLPHQLILIEQTIEEVEAITGVGYFD